MNKISSICVRTMATRQKLNFDISDIKSIIPKLSNDLYKGQCGRIGVIGGSKEYTGAPYFAAMAALRLGADLVHIYCPSDAGPVIKSYSPDLIVHPILDDRDVFQQLGEWLPRMHSIVFGPGLGRDNIDFLKKVLDLVKEVGRPTVIDADGLFVVSEHPNVLQNFHNVILTPNIIEYKRILSAVSSKDNDIDCLFEKFNYITLIKKGEIDQIFNRKKMCEVVGGSICRCGGQGDVLAGSIAVFTYWAQLAKHSDPCMLGVYSGCCFTKALSSVVFKEKGRSMVTGDFFASIHSVFRDKFHLD